MDGFRGGGAAAALPRGVRGALEGAAAVHRALLLLVQSRMGSRH